MKSVQEGGSKALLQSAGTREKRAYTPPVLTLFGHVAALTQSGTCSAASDGANAPCQVAGGAMGMSSDRRLKQNIVRIGEHPAGFGLYLFEYKHSPRARQFGVMADEVAQVMPEAVLVGPDGYRSVRYDMLGISPALH
jgi:hypothetical protein